MTSVWHISAVAAFATFWLADGLWTGGSAFATEQSAALSGEDAERLFSDQILPLLKRRCFACHGDAKELEGDLDLRSRAALLRGGESGEPALVPGKPALSPLYQAVLRSGELVMPPKERNKLTTDQVALLRRWIVAGAPWPEARPDQTSDSQWDVKDGIAITTSGGQKEDWTRRKYRREDVWAYFPVKQYPVPPSEGDEQHVNNPIDAFILRGLRRRKLAPAPAADRRTWMRRVTFDVTGLPPTPEKIDAFLADRSLEARGKVIDRLLDSPHYGERMAQHWLDVVRYADTSGFSNDYERPNAWRYRDYVIRSFNNDKPYDRFIIEQIAGDELRSDVPGSDDPDSDDPDSDRPGSDRPDGDDPELRIAAGYLRMGPWEHTGMSVAAVTRQMFLDDVTNSVGVTFLAQGLRCARCHDHKFDPVPTRDYYAVQAVFASTRFDAAPTPFAASENTGDFAAGKARVERLIAADDWMSSDDPKNDSAKRVSRKRSEYLRRARQRYEPISFSAACGEEQDVHVLVGGSLESPGERVGPGVLSAVQATDHGTIPEAPSGRRLALARWIASPDNPLTARVMVNRVWQMHFGAGIVATPNNFGKMGRRPSHPQLLDWLARWFVRHDWSIKRLHRLILSSATYQRGGAHPRMETIRRVDPNSALLAYFPPRRLTAEEIRDAMLAASGELSPAMGGPGIFPEINWEAAFQPRHIMGAIAPAYQPSPRPEERNRRTIYAFRYRTLADPMLEVFNRPGADVSCERRDETTITPQVFTLLNGRNSHNRALALARRLEKFSTDRDRQIDRAFQLVLGRPPTDRQRGECREHIEQMIEHHRRHEPVRSRRPTKVAREMIDEQTGKPFRWDERLLDMLDYQADLEPWEVGPETRGLSELCLVLLNSNEFVYVY